MFIKKYIGHSLGAAEATLAAADLTVAGYHLDYFMTFGNFKKF